MHRGFYLVFRGAHQLTYVKFEHRSLRLNFNVAEYKRIIEARDVVFKKCPKASRVRSLRFYIVLNIVRRFLDCR